MSKAMSLLRSPSTVQELSIYSLNLETSSSVKSLTRVSGFTPVAAIMSLAVLRPIPKI